MQQNHLLSLCYLYVKKTPERQKVPDSKNQSVGSKKNPVGNCRTVVMDKKFPCLPYSGTRSARCNGVASYKVDSFSGLDYL